MPNFDLSIFTNYEVTHYFADKHMTLLGTYQKRTLKISFEKYLTSWS